MLKINAFKIIFFKVFTLGKHLQTNLIPSKAHCNSQCKVIECNCLTLLYVCQQMEVSCLRWHPGGPFYPMTVTSEHLVLAAPALESPWWQRWSQCQFCPCASLHNQIPGQAAREEKKPQKNVPLIKLQSYWSLTLSWHTNLTINPVRIFLTFCFSICWYFSFNNY